MTRGSIGRYIESMSHARARTGETSGSCPAVAAADSAQVDDEPETDEELQELAESRADVRADRIVNHDEVRRRWLDSP